MVTEVGAHAEETGQLALLAEVIDPKTGRVVVRTKAPFGFAWLGDGLAYTLADGMEYVRRAVAAGLPVDTFAPRLSFFFAAHNDLFEEVAKFRAARRLYARLMRERFGASDASCRLRFHTQTGGVTLTAQQPLNNVARVALETLAVESATQGAQDAVQREKIRHLEARFEVAWGGMGAVACTGWSPQACSSAAARRACIALRLDSSCASYATSRTRGWAKRRRSPSRRRKPARSSASSVGPGDSSRPRRV